MRVGIFGGSFDPVHNGHIKLARFAAEECKLDRLLIVPAYCSPGKAGKTPGTDDRLAMCRLAFSDPVFSVVTLETDRGGKSYTADTVDGIQKLYGSGEYFLILGADQLYKFDQWIRFRELLSFVTLFAAARSGQDSTAAMERFAEERLRPYGKCVIGSFAPENISSTQVRELIKNGESVSELLPESVYTYIKSRGLYK